MERKYKNIYIFISPQITLHSFNIFRHAAIYLFLQFTDCKYTFNTEANIYCLVFLLFFYFFVFEKVYYFRFEYT